MKKAKPKMIDIFLESFYQSADEDSSILQGGARFSNNEFKSSVENATVEVDRLIARIKRSEGLRRIQKAEKLFQMLKERTEGEVRELVSSVIPDVQPQAIQVFHRKLNDEESEAHVEDDQVFLELLNNVDDLMNALENE